LAKSKGLLDLVGNQVQGIVGLARMLDPLHMDLADSEVELAVGQVQGSIIIFIPWTWPTAKS